MNDMDIDLELLMDYCKSHTIIKSDNIRDCLSDVKYRLPNSTQSTFLFGSFFPPKNIFIEIPNLKDVSSQDLKSLECLKDAEKYVYIRVLGPYNIEEATNIKKSPNQSIRSTGYSIYTISELRSIVEEMEIIESGLEGNETDLQKAAYIYNVLANAMICDEKGEQSVIHSLRGLIKKKSICNGYSKIYKELLDRQKIDCHFVVGYKDKKDWENGKNYNHAWNVITIDGKNYPVDLTWESNLLHQSGKMYFKYFTQDTQRFSKLHFIPKDAPYFDLELSSFTEEQIQEVKNFFNKRKIEISTLSESANPGNYQTRKDSTRMSLTPDNLVPCTGRTHTTSSEISSAENEVENSLSKNDKSHSVDE